MVRNRFPSYRETGGAKLFYLSLLRASFPVDGKEAFYIARRPLPHAKRGDIQLA